MLAEILEKYLEIFPEERKTLKRLSEQIKAGERLDDRKNFRGHIAGDGIVLTKDRNKILMIHHNVYKMWMQPGGHWDADDINPLAVAKREVTEETGLRDFSLLEWQPSEPTLPFDITLDHVPANPIKGESEHFHHTFAYIFVAQNKSLHHQPSEVSGAKWAEFNMAEKSQDSHFPHIIKKLQQFNLI